MIEVTFEAEPDDPSVGMTGGWFGSVSFKSGAVETSFDFVPTYGLEVGEWVVGEINVYVRAGKNSDGGDHFRNVGWQDEPNWKQSMKNGVETIEVLRLKHIPLATGAVINEWKKIQAEERSRDKALAEAFAGEAGDGSV